MMERDEGESSGVVRSRVCAARERQVSARGEIAPAHIAEAIQYRRRDAGP
jgi:hypothetical protein